LSYTFSTQQPDIEQILLLTTDANIAAVWNKQV